MRIFTGFLAISICMVFCGASVQYIRDGWISLFDGTSLKDWKVGAHAETFKVDSGMIIANGETAHLFYDGDVQGHNFKIFEF